MCIAEQQWFVKILLRYNATITDIWLHSESTGVICNEYSDA